MYAMNPIKTFYRIMSAALALSVLLDPLQGVPNGRASRAGGPELWAVNFDGQANLEDKVSGMVVDGAGNIYVTGESQGSGTNFSDYATVKYSPSGEQLWERVYDGPGQTGGYDEDEARAIAVDVSGNVYVTGRSTSINEFDYLTIKYSPEGSMLWSQRYDGPGNQPGNQGDEPNALTLDANFVYITGQTINAIGNYEFATLKYALEDGQLVWEKRYPGMTGRAIAVDGDGNVYVTGEEYRVDSDIDFALVKYAPDGTQLWIQHYTGPGSLEDVPTTLALDISGNILISGASGRLNPDAVYDQVTVKFAPDGTLLWARRYEGPLSQGATANALAVDDEGNTIIAGSAWAGNDRGQDYTLLKYDPDGNLLWEQLYDGPVTGGDEAKSLALDSEGNIYVTGNSDGYTLFDDVATLKFDPQGNALWVMRYDGPTERIDQGAVVATDILGNVIVSGQSDGDYLTLKYSPSPGLTISIEDAKVWEDDSKVRFTVNLSQVTDDFDIYVSFATADGTASAGSDYIARNGILVIERGQGTASIDIQIIGDTTPNEGNESFFIDLSFPTNASLANGRAQGTIWEDDIDLQLWARRYHYPGSYYEGTVDLAVDQTGNVYVTGNSDIGPSNIATTMKYDPDGVLLWTQDFPGRANDLEVTPKGIVFVTGTDSEGNMVILLKYAPNGSLIWERSFAGPIGENCYSKGVALDVSGNAYIAGTCATGLNEGEYLLDAVVLKYSSGGDLLWDNYYDSPDDRSDNAWEIQIDSAGNVVVSGGSVNTMTGTSLLVLKYNGGGELLWVSNYSYENVAGVNNMVYDMEVDGFGNIFIAGQSNKYGQETALTLKFSSNGDLVWEHASPGGNAVALAVDQTGHVYVTGYANNRLFIKKLSPNGDYIWMHILESQSSGTTIALDLNGNIYVSGTSFDSAAGLDNIITLAYDANGTRLLRQSYHKTGEDPGQEMATGMSIDEPGYIYVTGESSNDFATIKYNSILPRYLIIRDSYAKEEEAGIENVIFSIRLSAPQETAVMVDYSTADGTALAGLDYMSVAGTVTIPAHSLEATINVPIISDSVIEESEFFLVNLSNPSNASIADGQAIGTIWDSSASFHFLPITIRTY